LVRRYSHLKAAREEKKDMAWYNDFDDFCDAVEDVVEEAGEVIGTGLEAAGDAIDEGLNWLGEQTGEVGGAIFGWLGDVVNGGLHLAGSLIKAVFGIIGGIIGGVIRVIGGIFTLNVDRILTGLGDIFSSIIGGVVMILFKLVAAIQVIFGLGRERPLTDKEKQELRRVFRDSLNYYVIRVSEGHAGVFQPGNNRFVLGNTIYFKGHPIKTEYLVHEGVHVWQYPNGGARYTTDNVWAQMTEDNFHAPDVYVNEINDGKTEWDEFHPEAQAELIEGIWIEGELLDGMEPPPKGNGVFYDANGKSTKGRFVHGVDYTDIATNAVASIRDGRTPDWGFW
jgi:hypothetical protein